MATDVLVPTLGESITEATLGEWLKKLGDPVKADEAIASLETDKVSVEVPSPVAGTLGQQLVGQGDTVNVGAVIARIEAGDGAGVAAPASQPATATNPAGAGENPTLREDSHAPHAAQGEDSASDQPGLGDVALSPSVRRVVLENNLDPAQIKGTGKDGRVTKEDALAAVSRAPTAPAPSAPAQAGAQPAQ